MNICSVIDVRVIFNLHIFFSLRGSDLAIFHANCGYNNNLAAIESPAVVERSDGG